MYFTIRREKIMHFDKKKENCVRLISPSLRMHDGVVNMSQKEEEGEKAIDPNDVKIERWKERIKEVCKIKITV